VDQSPVEIDAAEVLAAMRTAFADPQAHLETWRAMPAGRPGGSGFTRGIFRIEAAAMSSGAPRSWAGILKILQPAADQPQYDRPTGHLFWRREAEAYASGALRDLPGGIRAPACYGVHLEARRARVWLEAAADEYDQRWPASRFELAARHLGQFNGGYLGEDPLPTFDTLQRAPMAASQLRVPRRISEVERIEAQGGPLWRKLFPTPIAPRLRTLWARREDLNAALDSLPQTLCHYDFAQHNLFSPPGTGDRETVVIDWESIGIAGIGQDAGVLVSTAYIPGDLPLSGVSDLTEAVFQSYLDGLADAGWKGDPAQVRFGYVADAALRWAFNMPPAAPILDDAIRLRDEGRSGKPFEETVAIRAAVTHVLLELAEEALGLLDR
jgi:hypothetical protein